MVEFLLLPLRALPEEYRRVQNLVNITTQHLSETRGEKLVAFAKLCKHAAQSSLIFSEVLLSVVLPLMKNHTWNGNSPGSNLL